jgi:hypothetical protein
MENIINGYRNVPYFNNKTTGRRAALAVHIGKGSSKDIQTEINEIAVREKIDLKSLSDEQIKKLLVDHNIGIECSGFAYYVLSEESKLKGKGELKGHFKFPFAHGVIGRLRSALRPVENIDVKTFAHDENSKVVEISDVKVGDIITMTKSEEQGVRDHILIVNKIDAENNLPKTLHYVHSVAWPTDGEYGSGLHEGKIEIVDLGKPIVDQDWIELGKTGEENYTHARARKSVTELRRLNWF